MKYILVEAPKEGVVWLAEQDGNLNDAGNKAKYGDHTKIVSLIKSDFNENMDLRRHPIIVSSIRIWLGLIKAKETNWSKAQSELAKIDDIEAFVISMGYTLEGLLYG